MFRCNTPRSSSQSYWLYCAIGFSIGPKYLLGPKFCWRVQWDFDIYEPRTLERKVSAQCPLAGLNLCYHANRSSLNTLPVQACAQCWHLPAEIDCFSGLLNGGKTVSDRVSLKLRSYMHFPQPGVSSAYLS